MSTSPPKAVGEYPVVGSTEDPDDMEGGSFVSRSPKPVRPVAPDLKHTRVDVFYGTNRNRVVHNSVVDYGKQPAEMDYGLCSVSIPKDHRLATLEKPRWTRLEFREDPDRHVMVLQTTPLAASEFFDGLKDATQAGKERSVLVFVHGFNVSFENAARRTAQLAYDLQFPGAPVFFSWPSQVSLSISGYRTDEEKIQTALPHLERFLNDVAERSKAKRVYLIAHSMGNRALTQALLPILEKRGSPLAKNCKSIILAAPDIDAKVFTEQIAPRLLKSRATVTLYASQRDRALGFSRSLHENAPRAGDLSMGAVVLPGLETVDATRVDTSLLGHSYYGDNSSVVTDLFHLVRTGLPAAKRPGLEPVDHAGGKLYRIQGQAVAVDEAQP